MANEVSKSCNFCGRIFNHLGQFKQHLRSHTGEKHVCSICNQGFSQKSSLNTHALIHSGIKSHECSICSKTFAHKGNLKLHQLVHTGEKSHSCEHCDKAFSQKSSLKKHILIHLGLKPFSCNECGKSFTNNGNLKKHLVTHSGDRPYSCMVCNKSFTQRESLNTHLKLHSGEKPFACDKCDKAFATKSNLQTHYHVHSSEKPYNCWICGKSYTQKAYFRSHVISHKEAYMCQVCDLLFSSEFSRQDHMQNQHQNDLQQQGSFDQGYSNDNVEKDVYSENCSTSSEVNHSFNKMVVKDHHISDQVLSSTLRDSFEDVYRGKSDTLKLHSREIEESGSSREFQIASKI